MKRARKWWVASGFVACLLACFTFLAPTASASALASSPFQETIANYADVHSGPTLQASVLAVLQPGSAVHVYGQMSGQALWAGNVWDRISPPSAAPRYIYAGMMESPMSGFASKAAPAVPASSGKEIVISLSQEWLWAYNNGVPVFSAPVTTARPGLYTPTGTWQIFSHLHPTTFYSPWPPGSPYYYPPTHINYAMEWNAGGFFLHDAYWRAAYGPGTNVWHHDPVDGWQYGTHGCITAPLQAIIWLYYWAPDGTTLQVNP